jgi:mgtE-like transporter
VISTVADIIVTACYVLCLSIFFSSTSLGYFLIGMLDFVFLSVVLYIIVKNAAEKEFVKTIREFLFTLIFIVFIVNLTGSLLNQIRKIVGVRPEIYIVYPALIDTTGDVGSIVGSTATTKLSLGAIQPSFSSIKQHKTEIGSAWTASVLLFALYSITSLFSCGIATLNNLSAQTARLLITNILAVSIMVVIAYFVAIVTYRRGWDPDNFVIPIESSLADSVTTIALLMSLIAIP